MGLLSEMFRSLLGRCPVCGGRLIFIQHDCIFGDLAKCNCCGRKWRIN